MIKKLTIERHRWDRGQGRHRSVADENGNEIRTSSKDPKLTIPNPNYKVCVFGFAMNSGKYKTFRDFALDNHDLIVEGKAIDINDDPKITDEQREELLKKELGKSGVKVEFVD